jgi:alpha-ketoglutarate-dependent taurine dioxygenase
MQEDDPLRQRIAKLSPAKIELLTRRLRSSPPREARRQIAPRKNRRGPVAPLSYAQERLWFLDRMLPGKPLYNIAGATRLEGDLDVSALYKTLSEIVRRHEVLRTTFPLVGGQCVQMIGESSRLRLPVVDLGVLNGSACQTEFTRLIDAEAMRPFDPLSGPLFRVSLLRLARECYVLQYTLHHLVADGWSLRILMHEIGALYCAYAGGRAPSLPELAIQYADFAVWQREQLGRRGLENQLEFWRRQLQGAPALLSLRGAKPRSEMPNFEGGAAAFKLTRELTEAVREAGRLQGATVFMMLLSALAAVLHANGAGTDLVIGTPVAGRDAPETEPLIGFFVNAVALRVNLAGNPKVNELLERVRAVCLNAYTLVFQVVCNFQETGLPDSSLPGLRLSPIAIRPGCAKYDLNLFVWMQQDCITGSLEYRLDLFDQGFIDRLIGEFKLVLTGIAQEPGLILDELCRRTAGGRKEHPEDGTMMTSQPGAPAGMRRRKLSLSGEALVKTSFLQTDQTIPLVFEPALPGIDLAEWAAGNLEFLETQLLRHGAILFRGFPVQTVNAFRNFASVAAPNPVNYIEGSSPRTLIGDKVYTSTEYPAGFSISMHSELSYAHRWPGKLLFYCQTPPSSGGETPIADNRKLLASLDPALVERFERLGVRYMRNLRGDRGPGLSWQAVFETDDRDVVEGYCREGNVEFSWKADGGLWTSQDRPATGRHPATGERIWFNQADQWHPSNLGRELAQALYQVASEADLPINAYYGDGAPFDPIDLDKIREAYDGVRVLFPWRQGDTLLLDNMLTAHGRMPFTGPRKVLVAMGSPVCSASTA